MRSTRWHLWRNVRCGLRGVRVGEASHPGPPKTGLRRLRSALTAIDSVEPTAADSRPTPSTIPAASGEVREALRRRTFKWRHHHDPSNGREQIRSSG